MYLKVAIHHLACTHSDHCPVLLKMDDHGLSSFCRPFRFQPMWMSHPLFPKVVADLWTEDGPLKLTSSQLMSRFGIEKSLEISSKEKKELRLDLEEFKLELLKGRIVIS